MIIVHYEVYVLEGRGWMLHARFPRTERETAVNEAKELEQTLNVRVKVLRETYYTDDNAFEESEIYISGSKTPEKRSAPARPSAASSSSSRSSSSSSTPSRPPARAAAKAAPPRRRAPQRSAEESAKARQVFGRLFAICAVGLAAALLAIKLTPNVIMLFWQIGFVITVTPESYGQLMFAVFILTFLMVAVPLAIRFLPRKAQLPGFHAPNLSWGGGSKPAQSGNPERDRAVKKSLDKLASKALAEADSQLDDKEEAALPEIKVDDLPEILPGPDDNLPEIRPDPADLIAEQQALAKKEREKMEAAAKTKDADKPEAKPEPPPPEAKKDEKKPAENTVSAESLQPSVMRFLNGALVAAKNIAPNMDAYTKFALHLYLAGAVETLCEFKKQGDSAKAKLVEMALETLGTRGELARKFYEKLDEYLLEPRYLGVVQAGRNAMGDFMLGDEAGAHVALRDVFLQWNAKTDKKAQIVTVMFTDMVGSTDMTQARGDAAAQEVVRRHNGIVRGALAQYSGKEIKHTGDGIMASFGTAAAAVEATISIQRQVAQINQRMPNLGLSLRIGLNAGEPIEEEDDLFGSTVQLAARVCAATEADQTLCTGVVKDLSVGKGATVFRPMGNKFMKGFKDAIPLYEVVWN
ncbi:MAG: adenylate/guanylate cyclase domain-containing protein [Rhodospirillaceae bacterium]|nr:adenylate/guanylate cyclase domain-containing protein [Rhodospirillales bacterium]